MTKILFTQYANRYYAYIPEGDYRRHSLHYDDIRALDKRLSASISSNNVETGLDGCYNNTYEFWISFKNRADEAFFLLLTNDGLDI